MSQRLAGQVAVVTGGSSGIGRAISRRFAEEGADIVIADIRDQPREATTPTHEVITEETDATVRYCQCDVGDRTEFAAAMEVADEFGGVDVLVNNAGQYRAQELTSVTEAEFDSMMNTNVKGTFFGTQLAAERMVPGDGGSIINLSSVAGLEGYGAYLTYCATKGAVRLMTYATADALGPEGVRANAIHPGLIDTAMTREDVPILGSEDEEEALELIPSRRAGQPEDVADAALFLASDEAEYVNGESLLVDGGLVNTA
jgi:NAD(P)-dependent dehydrogenase (short-subunit alcohol dehydrogenase family)